MESVRIAKISYTILAIFFCLLGTVMLLMPGTVLTWIAAVIGVGMILFGLVRILGYYSKDLYNLAFQNDLTQGVLMLVLGFAVLLHTETTTALIGGMIGIVILADGLLRIQMSMDARRFGLQKWWLVLTIAVLTVLAGIMLIFRPHAGGAALITCAGVALIVDGILNLCVAICTVKLQRLIER